MPPPTLPVIIWMIYWGAGGTGMHTSSQRFDSLGACEAAVGQIMKDIPIYERPDLVCLPNPMPDCAAYQSLCIYGPLRLR
jgi:hypothetical protein